MRMDSLATLTKPSALTAWAYSTIKESILNLSIRPGEPLRVEQFATQMRISRTPVREALLRLERDGLVRSVAHVGFFAASFSKRELRELYEVRRILESSAATMAATRIDEEGLASIDRVLMETRGAVKLNQLDQFLQSEIAFHRCITDHCGNSQLVNMVESLRDLTFRGRVLSLASPDNVRKSLEEHELIAEALHRRDSKSAGKLMSDHLTDAVDRMLQFVDLPED